MAEYPYSMSVGRMQEFIKGISSMGRPDKVTLKTLESRGFKSTNDRTIIPALKFLGIVDSVGTPTELWQALRDKENFPKVIAALIRDAYADVFQIFPDAHLRSEREIRNHMAANSKGADRMVVAMVAVFKMLCSLADFESAPVSPEEIAANRPSTDNLSHNTQRLSPEIARVEEGGVTLHFHLHLAENAGAEQIESVLKNVSKYLLGRNVD
jgi:hypothetical protein